MNYFWCIFITLVAFSINVNAQSQLPDFDDLERRLNQSFQEETATITVEDKEAPEPIEAGPQSEEVEAPPIVQKLPPREEKPYLDDKVINIGTGSITGIYYPLGGSICRLLNRKQSADALRCGIESTEGSVQNLSGLSHAEIDFAIVQSDWLEHAYKGTSIFSQVGPNENLRFVFSFYVEAMTFITRNDSKIIGLDDFKGKIINIGPVGSGLRATLFEMFKVKRWQKSDFKSLMQLSPYEQIENLCNGNLDVIVLATGHPNGLVQEVTRTCDAEILSIVDPSITAMLGANNEYAKTVIPGGLYFGNPNNKQSFGVTATLVTTTDMSDDVVYEVTKSVFENLEEFKRLHPVFYNLKIEDMVKNGITAPMHDGARRYFIEKGYIN